ncbi:MAG: hypothetical protein HY763_11140 [Planctomycetes bacterium]|nr:hypothetical protein [Planctomycetota bacterium]
MLDALDQQISEAQALVARRDQLRQALVEAKEQRGRSEYQLRLVEAALEQLTERLESMDGFSLGGLARALLGRREAERAKAQEDVVSVQEHRERAVAALQETEQHIQDMETELTELRDIDATLKALCDRKQQQLLASHGGAAGELRRVIEDVNSVKGDLARVEKAVQIGEHLVERLNSMHSSLLRARGRHLHGHGALASLVVNTVMDRSAGGAVGRVRDGLQQLEKALGDLPIDRASNLDGELVRMSVGVAELKAKFAAAGPSTLAMDDSVLGPTVDVVHQVLALLTEKRDRLRTHVKELETARASSLSVGGNGSPAKQ